MLNNIHLKLLHYSRRLGISKRVWNDLRVIKLASLSLSLFGFSQEECFFFQLCFFIVIFFKAQIDEKWPRFMSWSVKLRYLPSLLKKFNFLFKCEKPGPCHFQCLLMAWGFVQILCPCTACWKTRTGFNTCTYYLTGALIFIPSVICLFLQLLI